MTNENNKSDYNKPFMDLLKYLPEPHKSNVNESLIGNLFNRFLSKQDVKKVSGYIGKGTQNALVSRQIQEPDVHRQAFQLQPILNNKIGSIEHMASWEDIQNELVRLGVDVDDFANWGAVQQFNWVPPIDINKLVNYKDYFWIDENNNLPQYITIRSRCATATASKNFWEDIIRQYGAEFPIVDILPASDDKPRTTFRISTLTPTLGTIVVIGDARTTITANQFLDVIDTVSNNGSYQVLISPSYDGTVGTEGVTTFTVSGMSGTVLETNIGNVSTRLFDKITFGANDTILSGDYTDLFDKNFAIFLQVSENAELNNAFVQVITSTANANTNTTTVEFSSPVTNNMFGVDSIGSLNQQLSIYTAAFNCQCGVTLGFDEGSLWDDNPEIPLWGDSEGAGFPPSDGADGISDHQNLLDRITLPTAPNPAVDGQLWYDEPNDSLQQFSDVIGWKVVWNRFSALLSATTGTVLWDLLPSCAKDDSIEATNQWIDQNKWQHRKDVVNFAAAIRANQPIIEYDWDLELNEWTQTNYNWMYRASIDLDFTDVVQQPSTIELAPITWWVQDPSDANAIIIDARHGDLTDYFETGKDVFIAEKTSTDKQRFEILYSEYKQPSGTAQYRTYVTFTTAPPSTGSPVPSALTPSSYEIYPAISEAGDTWQGYDIHWLLKSIDDAVPVPHQTANPYAFIDPTSAWDNSNPNYLQRTTIYAQDSSITSQNVSVILLSDAVDSSIDTRSLRRKSLFDSDDIRVYVSNPNGEGKTRQYGNYVEVGELAVDVLAINIDNTNNGFFIPNGLSDYFPDNSTIELTGNNTYGTMEFTVVTTVGNLITVVEPIPVDMTETGQLHVKNNEVSTLTNPEITKLASENISIYAVGVRFFESILIDTIVTIEVGPSTINELGSTYNKVRMEIDAEIYDNVGNIAVTNTKHRKVEQIKSNPVSQYPLFDIFTTTGEPAYKANSLFGYRTDPSQDIDNNTGLRIVYDPISNIYEFDQFLLDNDDGELLAYRDYGSTSEDFWYNPETKIVKFWKGTQWDDKTEMDIFYRRAVVSPIEPSIRERNISGLYWYNTTTSKLFRRFGNAISGTWSEIQNIDTVLTDRNLRTIWRAGTNNDKYIPEQVDWIKRSEVDYNDQRDTFVKTRTAELLIEDISLTLPQATTLATAEWYEQEANNLSPDGTWIGDWEIPDPLYYNNLHENRKFLTSRELLTHFKTIISEQPRIPGYTGTADGMFALLPLADVNYSLGGTIKEFNDGFDTLLSSAFINNVTPVSLVEFAHDQYESLLNSLNEIYRKSVTPLLVNIEPENILNLSEYVSGEVIDLYEKNDQQSLVYGDTTTFTDVDGINDLGVRNWIATLPYVNLVTKQQPSQNKYTPLGINEVIHHDGHRNVYALAAATVDIISQSVVNVPDPRIPDKDMGVVSTNLPPDNINEFISAFQSPISNREGVYWYSKPISAESILYRYVVAESGTTTPSNIYADGTLWMDTSQGLEVLRIKTTNFDDIISWEVVDGLTVGDGRLHNGTDPSDLSTASISAWSVIDLDDLLSDTILEIENRLYDNVPVFPNDFYDIDNAQQLNPARYAQYLEEAFLEYVSQLDIKTPFKNTKYIFSDAFSWNYKHSVQGGGYSIINADGLTNSFIVSGDERLTFDASTFYIKNSSVNDGTWNSIPNTTFYNSQTNTTRIFVDGDVTSALRGVIYNGILPSSKKDSPSNLNDGSESGGDWRDVYTKFYNTPYPGMEPWLLQGYNEKPLWWDDEYLNNDKKQWGDRKWKYKHGFDITSAENFTVGNPTSRTYGIIGIDGNFAKNFISGEDIPIDNSVDHPSGYTIGKYDDILRIVEGEEGTASIILNDVNHEAIDIYTEGTIFYVANTLFTDPNSGVETNELLNAYTVVSVSHIYPEDEAIIIVEEAIGVNDIPIGTTFINGIMFNPFINSSEIKLSGLAQSSSATGRITKDFGMWKNIRQGIIPPNTKYPNGVTGVTGNPSTDVLNGLSVPNLPTFNYFSVNITNVPISTDGGSVIYPVDGVLPPYWDFVGAFSQVPVPFDRVVRSIFSDFSTEIITPNANYAFGDSGDVEWTWRVSSQFLYDKLTISYRIDPVRFVSSTFGFNFTEIGGLQIDRDVKNTPSHTRTNFHGDIVDDKQFKSFGLNQWYVNFNRYTGFDANFSDFKALWSGWKAPLTYQFSSFVDTPSLSVGHRFVDITNFDYNIKSKRSPGVDDYWLDALKISILKIPSDLIRYDNQNGWRFEITTNLPTSREIQSYDVRNYQFYPNITTNECWLYSWTIQSLETFNNTFVIMGDQTQIFTAGREFDIIGSTGNDATYSVFVSNYNSDTNTTDIIVNNNIKSARTDGVIKASYRDLPWVTGDPVFLSTNETMPIPLLSDTVNGLTKYFIIVDSNSVFRIADTLDNAHSGIAIDITTTGRGEQFVGEIHSTFTVPNSKTPWRFYTLDKSNVLTYRTPFELSGMQNLANMVSGFAAYMGDVGWGFNENNQYLDPNTARIVDWTVEMERFIGFAYAQRTRATQINDSYPVSVDGSTNSWLFNSENRSFITGDPIMLTSSNGEFPSPFSNNIRYYMIRDTLESFRLAESKTAAENGIGIDVLSTNLVGDLSLTIPSELKSLIPVFEINAFRNEIWFKPSRGIVSNVVSGPVTDIRSSQLIYNQNGEKINEDQIRVYRNDKETSISVIPADNNDTSLLGLINPEYDFSHLGGMHLFVDIYEHVMTLNNYTSEGNLLYDPFIGLNVSKYEMLFNRQPEFTHRPTVGGYYLETFFNQGSSIKENFEVGVENLRNAYDTYKTFETNLMTEYSRKGLGYEGTTDYLTNLNLSQKSQFIFWRGQIQNKGSVSAVSAFINSRRFIDAKIDDFWAIKVGEFGSMAEKEFPELFVTTVDSRSNELRLEFVANDLDLDLNPMLDSFKPIKMTDQERWYNQPDQIKVLSDNDRILYFDMKVKNKFEAAITGVQNKIKVGPDGLSYIKHNLDVDTVEVTQYNTATSTTITLEEGINYNITNNNIIEFVIGAPNISTDPLMIWGMVVNYDAQSPARIIDRESETIISPIQFWDPARGIHYKNAIHNVDVQVPYDPADYTDTPKDKPFYDNGNWKEEKVGFTWLDTNKLTYKPYYSEQVIKDTTERFRSWGQLSDWAEYDILEWVESDVPPSGWDAIATTEEGDRTIVEHLRKSGVARLSLFEKVPDWGANICSTGEPSYGSPMGEWVIAEDIIQEFNVATDADRAGSFYSFASVVNLEAFYRTNGLINVYINGKLYKADEFICTGNTYLIPMDTAKINDIITFIQHVPSQQEIDVEISAGTMVYDYEYSKVQYFDELGTEFFKYYFWVRNKRTKPLGKNRTMPIAEAEIQLNSIPSAHMFFQKQLPPKISNEEAEPVKRNDVHTFPEHALSQTFQYHVKPFTFADTVVKLNGIVLEGNGVDYQIIESPALITILPPRVLIEGDILEISYTGTHIPKVELPRRYSQVIIRGLQGIVNGDNRYTVRFNRNFTLRDSLDVENEKSESLDVKNLHSEWKIFRQEQQYNIDKWQWDRITECIVGFKLTDTTVRVPSYERELYDEKFGTDTQYGLGDGQAFANGQLALSSILAYLLDSGVEFTPIDINTFFINNSFDTPENIITSMNEIYNTFIYTNINRMYFSVLKDAFTTKSRYPGILKTSMVSLHGIRPFQTNGVFDD